MEYTTKDKTELGKSFHTSVLQHMDSSTPVHLSCHGSKRKDRGAERGGERRKASKTTRPALPGDWRKPCWFHSKPLTRGTLSFSPGLVSRDTNHSGYQILDSSVFLFFVFLSFSLLAGLSITTASSRIQLCFCSTLLRPADVVPSPPGLDWSNSIRMARSDMSQPRDD